MSNGNTVTRPSKRINRSDKRQMSPMRGKDEVEVDEFTKESEAAADKVIMDSVKGNEKVIAIFLADIHLTIKPPVWRSAEPNWLEAQARLLLEVWGLQYKYDCPIICPGDIFDRWNACPELINWAINLLPNNMHTIPGQHDLPLHQYEDIKRSAYWTLVEAGKIKDIKPFSHKSFSIPFDNFVIYGFPFGEKLTELVRPNDNKLYIAIVHDYVWIPGHSYPDAPREKQFRMHSDKTTDGRKYYGYDIIVYGDNHKGFVTKVDDTTIFNCGTLMRRKSDEIDYRPQVGLLLESGKVVPHYLDISKDKYLDTMDAAEKPDLDMTGFIDGLEKLGATALDFRDAMKMFLHSGKTSDEAKEIILNAMEK